MGLVVRAAAVGPLAALHVACSSAVAIDSADPYARCADLGEISLTATSRSDAELRMRARVRELGGDTLLFGMRGRSGPLADVPEEIAARRRELMAPPEPAVEPAPRPDATEIATPDDAAATDGPQRTPKTSVVEVQSLPGELWYYGAALRCNLAE